MTVNDNDGASASTSVDITLNNTHFESTISGQVISKGIALAEAEVTFNFAEIKESGIADEEGNFQIDYLLPITYASKPYTIDAKAGEINLSKVGLIEELRSSSSEIQKSSRFIQNNHSTNNTIATNDNNTSNDINEVTTAESKLLLSLYEEESLFFEQAFESISMFASQYDHISTEKLSELASFLVYMNNNAIASPTPFTFESLYSLINDYKSNDENFTSKMESASNTVVNSTTKSDSFSSITDSSYPLNVLPVLESASNTVRLGINFDPIYRFISNNEVNIINNDGLSYSANWLVNNNGSLTLTRTTATGRYTWQSGAGNIDYGSHGNCQHNSLSEDWQMLNKRGNAADAVIINLNWDVTCDDGFNGQYIDKYYISLTTEKQVKHFRENDIAEKTIAIELPGIESRGDNFVVKMLTFNSDGSGSNIDDSIAFDWAIIDGVLILNFSNGDSASLHKVQEDKKGAYGIVQLFEAANSQSFANQGMMVTANTGEQFTEESEYLGRLRSGFDASQPNQQKEIGFVISLEAEGVSSQTYTDTSGNVVDYFSALTTWGIVDNKLINSLKYNDWTNERCDPYSNTNCWWQQIRVWELIAKQGNRIYVKESLRRQSRPEDNLTTPSLTDSRLNFYEISQ